MSEPLLEPCVVESAERALADLRPRLADVHHATHHRALGRLVRDGVLALTCRRMLGDLGIHEAANALQSDGLRSELASGCAAALGELRAQQGPSGTFRFGDNVESPPDSAFTVNDLGWAAERLSESPGAASWARPLLEPLLEILESAEPALIRGGVHTPNHRWEISAALMRLHAIFEHRESRARAEQWLAEGVDLQRDHLFSERSPNYAALVSIPCLHVLARLLDRPDLGRDADDAARGLADLTDRGGWVETLMSRRQDQWRLFPGGPLHVWFRGASIDLVDPRCARAARAAAPHVGEEDALTLLAVLRDEPSWRVAPPAPSPEPDPGDPELIRLDPSGLVRVDHGVSSAVVYGGTDTTRIGRIASGASSNPTFLRFGGHGVSLTGARISRSFFSLGPVRFTAPHIMTTSTDGGLEVQLEELVSGEYFHPLPEPSMNAEGSYELEFNGRFAAAMDFSRRPADAVSLRTRATLLLSPRNVRIHCSFDGPPTSVCLVLAFSGGVLNGVSPAADGIATLGGNEEGAAHFSYGDGSEELTVAARGVADAAGEYMPGEEYTFLGGTDAMAGDIVLIPAMTTDDLDVTISLTRR